MEPSLLLPTSQRLLIEKQLVHILQNFVLSWLLVRCQGVVNELPNIICMHVIRLGKRVCVDGLIWNKLSLLGSLVAKMHRYRDDQLG